MAKHYPFDCRAQLHVSADYEWRLLAGVGHFPQHERPEQVSDELIRWAKLG